MLGADPTPSVADGRKLTKTRVPGIYKRGNRYVVIERDRRGRQIKRFAETLSEAQDKKAALRTDVKRGEHRPATTTLFTEYAAAWAARYKGRTSKGIKAQTLKDYQAAVARPEFRDHFRRYRLSEIEADDLIEYAEALKEQGLSPRTVRNLILPLRLCLATAHDKRHLRSNPLAGVKALAAMGGAQKATDMRALSEEQIALLLQAFDKKLDTETGPHRRKLLATVRLLAQFLLQTGCRIGEAVALRWSDFDENLTHVRISRRIYKGDEGTPKSSYGTRSVPLSPLLGKLLRELKDKADDQHAPVFASPTGKPLTYSSARRVFQEVTLSVTVKEHKDKKDKEGTVTFPLAWVTFHSLRHSCASWLFRPVGKGGLGASAPQAQRWLGHHSPGFTLSTYIHLMPDDLPSPDGFDRLLVLGATNGATRANERHRKSTPTRKRPKPAIEPKASST